MWFPKLMVSSYLQAEIGLWLFIIWSLTKNKNKLEENDENKKFNN